MTTNTEAFQQQFERFRHAKSIHENSRPGDPRAERAYRVMEQIVDQAEQDGTLNALLRTLYPIGGN